MASLRRLPPVGAGPLLPLSHWPAAGTACDLSGRPRPYLLTRISRFSAALWLRGCSFGPCSPSPPKPCHPVHLQLFQLQQGWLKGKPRVWASVPWPPEFPVSPATLPLYPLEYRAAGAHPGPVGLTSDPLHQGSLLTGSCCMAQPLPRVFPALALLGRPF